MKILSLDNFPVFFFLEIEECKDFQVVFRRLARTFYRAGVETVEFQYTDFTDRPNSAKLNVSCCFL